MSEAEGGPDMSKIAAEATAEEEGEGIDGTRAEYNFATESHSTNKRSTLSTEPLAHSPSTESTRSMPISSKASRPSSFSGKGGESILKDATTIANTLENESGLGVLTGGK